VNGKLTVYISNGIGNRLVVTTKADVVPADDLFRFVGFTYDGSSSSAGVTVYGNGYSFPFDVVEDTLSATIDLLRRTDGRAGRLQQEAHLVRRGRDLE